MMTGLFEKKLIFNRGFKENNVAVKKNDLSITFLRLAMMRLESYAWIIIWNDWKKRMHKIDSPAFSGHHPI